VQLRQDAPLLTETHRERMGKFSTSKIILYDLVYRMVQTDRAGLTKNLDEAANQQARGSRKFMNTILD
jgi:hypothetical protein